MNRRTTALIALVAIMAITFGFYQRATSGPPAGTIALAGDVRSDVRVVSAPAIQYPAPDFSVGIPTSGTTSPGGGARRSAPSSSREATVSGLLVAVYVAEGDHVKAGQKIAQLDTKMLDLGVAQAKASLLRARANVSQVNKGLEKVEDGEDKLATAREKLATGAEQLEKGQAQLTAGKKAALANKAKIQAGIKALEGTINGPHPPGPWPPPALVAKLAQLKAALAAINKALGQLPAAQAKLNQGKALLATGRVQLENGAEALEKAKKQLKKAKAVLTEVAKGQLVAVKLAQDRRAQATIFAPVDGVVTEARRAGTVAMVGAPVVRIRPDAATEIDTFVAGDQLPTVSLGSSATVNFDSDSRGPLHGTVTMIGNDAQFPPTSFPTSIVHMTRTVRVRITLNSGDWAPPGTPVDVSIKTTSGR